MAQNSSALEPFFFFFFFSQLLFYTELFLGGREEGRLLDPKLVPELQQFFFFGFGFGLIFVLHLGHGVVHRIHVELLFFSQDRDRGSTFRL